MSNQTTALAPRRNGGAVIRPELEPLRDYLTLHNGMIKAAIPPRVAAQINVGAIVAAVLIEVEREPKLLRCTPQSLLRCTLMAVELGLRPGAAWGEAYLIPYGQEAQLQVGYKGLQRLAYEAGAVDTIQAHVVYQREVDEGRFELSYEPQRVRHSPILSGDRGPVVGAYFLGKRKGEIVGLEWCSKEDLDKINSKAQGGSPARKDWREEMDRKSVTKRGLKRIPVGVDGTLLQRAVLADNRAETGQTQVDLLPLPQLSGPEREAADRAAAAYQQAHEQQVLQQRQEATGAALADLTGAPSAEEVARAEAGDRAEQAERAARRGRS